MKIIVDAMGGDYAPVEIVKGAVEAVKEKDITVVLVGIKEKVEHELAKYPKSSKIEIIEATETIEMSEHPVEAVRAKKKASINLCMQEVKEKRGDAVISAGNTGAIMAAALFNLGRIKGIERPAICSLFPAIKKPIAILDIGANSECRSSHLVQFAHMGKAFCERVAGIENPKIGLLSVGSEAEKGSEMIVATNKVLKEDKNLNFIGNIEGNDIMNNVADVVVCDGFVGNVVLKFAEGMFHTLKTILRQEILKSPLAMLASFLQIFSFRRIRKRLDYTEYGGAPLLGVNGICIITHGRAKSKTMKNAILAAVNAKEHNLIEAINNIGEKN